MIQRRAIAAVALSCAATALLAAPASAATKTVFAGPNLSKPPEGLEEATTNDFFRRTVTIRQGDSVRWQFRGFHNVVFPKRGEAPPPLFAPDPVIKYTGLLDAAGQPFFFNGTPRIGIDARSAFPQGGRTYTGAALVGSGLPEGEGEPKPYTIRFTRRGTFGYVCTIHPGMAGKVKVVARSRRVPTARQDRAAASRQLAGQIRTARRLGRLKPPAATVSAGSDKRPVAWLKFFPASQTVQVGQPVTLTVPGRQEPHTFSFGPEAYLKSIVDAQITPVPNPAGGPPTLVFDGRVINPSDPPPSFPAITPTIHGNGFFSTGVLLRGTPGGTTTSVRFGQAGTYSFICLIHPEMKGTITAR